MKFKAAFTICFVFGFFLKSFVPVAIAQNEMLYAGLAVAPPDTVPPDLSEFDDLFEEDDDLPF